MTEVPPDPHLATERLLLLPVVATDVPALYAHWTDPEVRRYLWDGQVIPREQVEEVVQRSQALFHELGFGLWSLRERASSELVGCGGFWYFREPPELELVLSLSPAWWGRGLATEAARALLAYGFDALLFEEVQASSNAPNAASIRLMERLGMRRRREGVLQGVETVVYALPRAGWAGTPGE